MQMDVFVGETMALQAFFGPVQDIRYSYGEVARSGGRLQDHAISVVTHVVTVAESFASVEQLAYKLRLRHGSAGCSLEESESVVQALCAETPYQIDIKAGGIVWPPISFKIGEHCLVRAEPRILLPIQPNIRHYTMMTEQTATALLEAVA